MFDAEENLSSSVQDQQLDSKENTPPQETIGSNSDRDSGPITRALASVRQHYEQLKVWSSRGSSSNDIEMNG
jgi:hypothetical protein